MRLVGAVGYREVRVEVGVCGGFVYMWGFSGILGRNIVLFRIYRWVGLGVYRFYVNFERFEKFREGIKVKNGIFY